ncbi:hypothetical protein [Streptomyces luteocolor]|uniref:hypothetical protein n=1 Tax=Streptomyces luteocolor TaxID=285500 RepID=UPI001EDC4B7B|nr:hypothetical protein [Streptomyces luteocolor]
MSAELDRLDRSANALAGAGDDEADRLRLREEAVWQVRFETAFADLGEQERGQAAEALRALLREHTAPGGVVAGEGQSVGGNVHIRADHGSAAAPRMGDVTFGNPPQPGPPQG